ncbi:MAG: condensation domain-containing protein [Gemmatimonadota bacterium]|nr:condensation domain-containing protein [Gemmatimonadota bacterium]
MSSSSSWSCLTEVDSERLRRAWQVVIDRHEMLRASVERDGRNQASWKIHETAPLPFEMLDWEATAEHEVEARFESFLQDDRARGFRLDDPPLTRVTLMRLADDRYRCVATVPHIVLDAGSFVRVLDEVLRVYDAEGVPDLPPARSYTTYLDWRANHDVEGAEAFWKDLLQGYRTPIDVSAGGTEDGGTLEISRELPEGVTRRLTELAEPTGVRLSATVLAAWSMVLAKLAGEDDVVFGQTRSGRPGTVEGADEMVGLFINTVPTRARPAARRPLRELLTEIREQQVGAPAVRAHTAARHPGVVRSPAEYPALPEHRRLRPGDARQPRTGARRSMERPGRSPAREVGVRSDGACVRGGSDAGRGGRR